MALTHLIIVRHAKAEQGFDDFHRELTPKGRRQWTDFVPEVGAVCRQNIADFDALPKTVYTSPMLRALATAEILCDVLDWPEPVPDDTLMEYELAPVRQLAESAGTPLVFLVGHEPMCSDWTARLTGQWLEFKKGQVVALEIAGITKKTMRLAFGIRPDGLPVC